MAIIPYQCRGTGSDSRSMRKSGRTSILRGHLSLRTLARGREWHRPGQHLRPTQRGGTSEGGGNRASARQEYAGKDFQSSGEKKKGGEKRRCCHPRRQQIGSISNATSGSATPPGHCSPVVSCLPFCATVLVGLSLEGVVAVPTKREAATSRAALLSFLFIVPRHWLGIQQRFGWCQFCRERLLRTPPFW